MYLYFDKLGVLKEIINDGAIRLGDDNADTIYVYLEGEPDVNALTMKWWNYSSETPDERKEILFDGRVLKEVPYDKKRDLEYFEDYKKYNFYRLTIPSGALSVAGLYYGTIRAVYRVSEQNEQKEYIKAQGMITFNVENNIINVDNRITQSQYDYLIKYVANKVGGILKAYIKSVTYNHETYTLTFVNQQDQEIVIDLPIEDLLYLSRTNEQDIRALEIKHKDDVECLTKNVAYNRVGLMVVNDYNEDTGEITFLYNPSMIRYIDYDETTGIMSVSLNPKSFE